MNQRSNVMMKARNRKKSRDTRRESVEHASFASDS